VSEVITTDPETSEAVTPVTSVLITVATSNAVAFEMSEKSPVLKVAVCAPPPSTATSNVCPSTNV